MQSICSVYKKLDITHFSSVFFFTHTILTFKIRTPLQSGSKIEGPTVYGVYAYTKSFITSESYVPYACYFYGPLKLVKFHIVNHLKACIRINNSYTNFCFKQIFTLVPWKRVSKTAVYKIYSNMNSQSENNSIFDSHISHNHNSSHYLYMYIHHTCMFSLQTKLNSAYTTQWYYLQEHYFNYSDIMWCAINSDRGGHFLGGYSGGGRCSSSSAFLLSSASFFSIFAIRSDEGTETLTTHTTK